MTQNKTQKRQPCLKRQRRNDIFFSILLVMLVCLFPIIFLYAQNADEVAAREMLQPMLYMCGSGILVFSVMCIFCRCATKAAVISSVVMLAMLNYSIIERIMKMVVPSFRYWHCVALLLFILTHIGWVVAKKLPLEGGRYAVRIGSAVFGLLILMNVVPAVPTIIDKVNAEKQIREQREEMVNIQAQNGKANPNIYYIILDEYSGFNTIKKIYDYDNEPFARHLESIGFTVSRDSYNDEIDTMVVTANLMNLNYDASATTSTTERNSIRQNGRLWKVLSEQGYTTLGVGANAHIYGLERVDLKEQATSATLEGYGFCDVLYTRTVCFPFFTQTDLLERQADVLTSFAYLKNHNNFPPANTFILVHLLFPHSEFVFDRNGNIVPQMKRDEWEDKKYYLDQYIYCTERISEVVDSIVADDPRAIVILQSDHSARAASNKSLYMRLIPYDDMKNILNAVYVCGEQIDEIQGQSGVNTLRLLLNRLFGYDFDVLEVPYGSFDIYARQVGLED